MSLAPGAIQHSRSPSFDRFSIWGTSAVLGVTDAAVLAEARAILDTVLALSDHAASRFHPGTEILALNDAAGQGPMRVSATMIDLVAAAIDAARSTGGACDPTVADRLVVLGYDRDFDAGLDDGVTIPAGIAPAPGIEGIVIDHKASTIALPAGVHLDLGATAKARTADIAAEQIATDLDVGCLVDLGGDLRIAGPPPAEGWQIGITREARTGRRDEVDEVIAVTGGGIASSSSGVRRWQRGATPLHHLIDPATGWPVAEPLAMVTVAAPTCLAANALSTASMVWGERCLFELPQRSVAARVLRDDGTIERIGGWPSPVELGRQQ
jgi:thiamine biosynthesis lipoprotein